MVQWRRLAISRRPGKKSGFASTALVGRGDVQIFAVLGDGATGDLNSLPLEQGSELVVGEGVARVFFFNQLADFALENYERGVGSFGSIGSLGEEESQFDYALRGVGIFVGDGAADRRWMNADLFRDLFNHHWAKCLDTDVEELLLSANDHFACAENRAFALCDITHELHG